MELTKTNDHDDQRLFYTIFYNYHMSIVIYEAAPQTSNDIIIWG